MTASIRSVVPSVVSHDRDAQDAFDASWEDGNRSSSVGWRSGVLSVVPRGPQEAVHPSRGGKNRAPQEAASVFGFSSVRWRRSAANTLLILCGTAAVLMTLTGLFFLIGGGLVSLFAHSEKFIGEIDGYSVALVFAGIAAALKTLEIRLRAREDSPAGWQEDI
jgi:hypothetical protein